MGIKGKTTFELTDVNTGKVEIIEDANMVTNGIEDFLNTYGIFANNLFDNSELKIFSFVSSGNCASFLLSESDISISSLTTLNTNSSIYTPALHTYFIITVLL